MSDNSYENYEESRIQELMKKYNCTRENAEKRRASSRVAFAVLNPDLFKPQPQPQQETAEVEETEESEPTDEVTQKKLEILDTIQQQLTEQNEFSDLLSDPEWRHIFKNYIYALRFLAGKKCDFFVQVVKQDGKNLEFHIEYYRNDGKKVSPIEVYTSESEEDD